MANLKTRLLVAAAIIAGSFGVAPTAFAGEGGIAGSAAFDLEDLNGSFVEEASAAVAIGKATAYAGATTFDDGTGTIITEAFAAGTGGQINFNGASFSPQLTDIAEDTQLGVVQANDLDAQSVNINVIGGTVDLIN